MRLLLDVHFSPAIAEQLRTRGHDAIAAAQDRELRQLSDQRLLERAAADGRALLTNNVKDFVPIAADWARSGRDHLGLLLTSDRSMPRTRHGIGQLVTVLDDLMAQHPDDHALVNQVLWPATPDP